MKAVWLLPLILLVTGCQIFSIAQPYKFEYKGLDWECMPSRGVDMSEGNYFFQTSEGIPKQIIDGKVVVNDAVTMSLNGNSDGIDFNDIITCTVLIDMDKVEEITIPLSGSVALNGKYNAEGISSITLAGMKTEVTAAGNLGDPINMNKGATDIKIKRSGDNRFIVSDAINQRAGDIEKLQFEVRINAKTPAGARVFNTAAISILDFIVETKPFVFDPGLDDPSDQPEGSFSNMAILFYIIGALILLALIIFIIMIIIKK